jgi:hypothetical protein
MAEMFFYNVSSALKDRGIFYGIVPSAKAMLALMGDKVPLPSRSTGGGFRERDS